MKLMQCGVFAQLVEHYNNETCRIEEKIALVTKDWCDETGIEYWKKSGLVLVCVHEFMAEEPTREQVVSGMVEGLREKRTEVQAEAQRQITEIDGKINRLLQLTYTEAPSSEFAPRTPRDLNDVEDV